MSRSGEPPPWPRPHTASTRVSFTTGDDGRPIPTTADLVYLLYRHVCVLQADVDHTKQCLWALLERVDGLRLDIQGLSHRLEYCEWLATLEGSATPSRRPSSPATSGTSSAV